MLDDTWNYYKVFFVFKNMNPSTFDSSKFFFFSFFCQMRKPLQKLLQTPSLFQHKVAHQSLPLIKQPLRPSPSGRVLLPAAATEVTLVWPLPLQTPEQRALNPRLHRKRAQQVLTWHRWRHRRLPLPQKKEACHPHLCSRPIRTASLTCEGQVVRRRSLEKQPPRLLSVEKEKESKDRSTVSVLRRCTVFTLSTNVERKVVSLRSADVNFHTSGFLVFFLFWRLNRTRS